VSIAELGNQRDLGTAQLARRAPRRAKESSLTIRKNVHLSRSIGKPAAYKAQSPESGVELHARAVQANDGQQYWLSAQLVSPWKRCFGHSESAQASPVNPELRKPHPFWDVDLAGSTAGRFLMGAGKQRCAGREHAETAADG